MRPTVLMALAVAGGAASTAACSVLLDWSGYGGGGSDGGHAADATVHDANADGDLDAGPGVDAPSLVSCGVDKLCSPAVPLASGWAGPYALLVSDPASLPACDLSAYLSAPAFEGKGGLDAGPARCGCSCSAPEGVGCTAPNVTFFSDPLCDASTACGPPVPVDTCVQIGSCPNLSIDGPKATGGGCTPAAGMTLPPSSWEIAARACAPSASATQGSCRSGEVCLPSGPPFCIMNVGDLPCPAGGDYPFRRVYYAGSSDQRGCTTCSCGAPSGGACSFPPSPPSVPPVGSFDSTCTVPFGQPFFVPLTCASKVPSTFAVQVFRDAGPSVTNAGSCQADGGIPSGNAVPTGPTTFCCTR